MLTKGTEVRFTASRLGTVRDPNQNRFEAETVERGDHGIYEGPHPTLEEWHLVRVGDGTLFVPCHVSQFEVVPLGERLAR